MLLRRARKNIVIHKSVEESGKGIKVLIVEDNPIKPTFGY